MTADSTRLVIADDHPLFRDALRQAVASVVTGAVIDEAGSFDDLTALLEQDSEVDLIMLDLSMPGISGFSGLIYLRAQRPEVPVVIVSATEDPVVIVRILTPVGPLTFMAEPVMAGTTIKGALRSTGANPGHRPRDIRFTRRVRPAFGTGQHAPKDD